MTRRSVLHASATRVPTLQERGTGGSEIKALRWTAASLLGLLGGVLGLVGLLLCVTVILAPVGIPVLLLSRRLFRTAGQLVIPRKVRHPIEAMTEAGSDAAGDLGGKARKRGRRFKRSARKLSRRAKRRL